MICSSCEYTQHFWGIFLTDALALSRASSRYDLGCEVAAGVWFSFLRMSEDVHEMAGVGSGASEDGAETLEAVLVALVPKVRLTLDAG